MRPYLPRIINRHTGSTIAGIFPFIASHFKLGTMFVPLRHVRGDKFSNYILTKDNSNVFSSKEPFERRSHDLVIHYTMRYLPMNA